MRISDWSSDVCSSDLNERQTDHGADQEGIGQRQRRSVILLADRRADGRGEQRLGKALIGGGDARHMAEILHRDRAEIAADKADEPDIDHHQRGEHPQRSEEHTSELKSLMRISYAVFCLKKNKTNNKQITL